jgi:hypothetical protein
MSFLNSIRSVSGRPNQLQDDSTPQEIMLTQAAEEVILFYHILK